MSITTKASTDMPRSSWAHAVGVKPFAEGHDQGRSWRTSGVSDISDRLFVEVGEMADAKSSGQHVVPRGQSTNGISARKKAAVSKAAGHIVDRVPAVKAPVKNRKASSVRSLKHTPRSRTQPAASGLLLDALVMPVTRPSQSQVQEVADLVARGSEITLIQGTTSIKVGGPTLEALRQLLTALSAGPLSLVMGDEVDTELTSQEAADLLNVSRPHVVKLAREGQLPHRRVGNRHRFLLSDIQEFGRVSRIERERALTAIAPEAGYSPEDF
jgi:excisionase family DNA binding protein